MASGSLYELTGMSPGAGWRAEDQSGTGRTGTNPDGPSVTRDMTLCSAVAPVFCASQNQRRRFGHRKQKQSRS
jgi:hypothetical protein